MRIVKLRSEEEALFVGEINVPVYTIEELKTRYGYENPVNIGTESEPVEIWCEYGINRKPTNLVLNIDTLDFVIHFPQGNQEAFSYIVNYFATGTKFVIADMVDSTNVPLVRMKLNTQDQHEEYFVLVTEGNAFPRFRMLSFTTYDNSIDNYSYKLNGRYAGLMEANRYGSFPGQWYNENKGMLCGSTFGLYIIELTDPLDGKLKHFIGFNDTYLYNDGLNNFPWGRGRCGLSGLYCLEDMNATIEIPPEEPEPDPSFGQPSRGGGYDNPPFDDSSDPIGVPNNPIFNISNLGYLNTYSVGATGLNGMIDEIFPHLDDPTIPEPTGEGTLSDLARSVNAMANGIVNFCINFANQNISQYITDIHLLPVSPTVGSSEHIRVGYRELSLSAPVVTSDYVTFDCGTLSIAEYYQNFIDYVGTRAQLYLPFYGFVPIEPEYFQSGSLHVVYKFNIIDGSFVAYVLSTSSKSQLTDSVIGTFSGNCCVHVPITSNAFASICSGLVSGVAHGISMSSAPTFAQEDGGSIGSTLSTFVKPTIPLSNGFNATSSYTGIRYPYLVISRKVASFSRAYPHEKGLPCNVSKRLSEVSGFASFNNLHLDGLTCTEEERRMIESYLKQGVILPVVN